MVVNILKSKLNKCETLSFTTDIWSSTSSSFISLTAHGIDNQWQRVKYVLAIRELPGSHTGYNINSIIKEILREREIEEDRCHVFLRGGAANMKKAFEGELEHADCGAHQLNTAVKTTIESNQRGCCDKMEFDTGHGGAPSSTKMTFGNLLCLIRSAVRCQKLVWKRVGAVETTCRSTEPADASTKDLCRDDSHLGLQLAISHMLLVEIRKANVPGLVTEKNLLIAKLKARFSGLESNRNYGLPLFLDPRFKDMLLEDSLEGMFARQPNVNRSEVLPVPNTCMQNFDSELVSYNAERTELLDSDPLIFWLKNVIRFPILSKAASRLLAAPSTSVASEQLFSRARDVFHYKRNSRSIHRRTTYLFEQITNC